MSDRKVKLFLSHAWEDKEAIAQRLYEALKDKFDVWYDTESLQIGDSLTFKIGEGLKSCDYAIVVLSPTYITKKWTREEFVGLVNLETNEKKILLPIWHEVTRDQVLEFSPSLADRVAGKSNEGIDVIVARIEGIVFGSQKARELGDPLQREFAAVADRFAVRDLNERLSRSDAGVAIVRAEVGRLFDVFLKRLDQVRGRLDFQKSALNRLAGPMAIRVAGLYQVTLEILYDNRVPNETTDDELSFQIFTPNHDYPSVSDEKHVLDMRMFTSEFSIGPRVIWRSTFGDHDETLTSEQFVERALSSFSEKLGSYEPEIDRH